MTWSQISQGLVGYVRRVPRLGLVLVVAAIAALVVPSGAAEACTPEEATTLGKLTTSEASTRIAHATRKTGETWSKAASVRLSAAIPRVGTEHCCHQGSMPNHGHVGASAACPSCLPGIEVDGLTFAPCASAGGLEASLQDGVAECDVIPDLPPPRAA